ncbi:hypothetical protein LBMAG18_00420 [Alphaproteobacteria bacterium]|nr:hypothetical protein LBMAG18_00420 [Alphaproteobacteria bacterium]
MNLLKILKIYKKYFSVKFIALGLILLLTSCSGSGCVEADDFGNQENQTINVYSNINQSSCDYDASVSDEDQTSEIIKTCLTSGTKNITDENQTTYTSSTGCLGFSGDAKINKLCRDQCINECQVTSTSYSSKPSWVSNSALLSDSGSGVNIYPNSEISISAKGSLNLGNNITLPPSTIYFNEIMPNSYGLGGYNSANIIDVGKGQSIDIKFSKSSDSGVSPAPIDDYNFARRLVGYITPHPSKYEFDYSNPLAGDKKVPLTPRFNGWKCKYNGIDSNESSCSNTTPLKNLPDNKYFNDNYNSDDYQISSDIILGADNFDSSVSFNVGSDSKKFIDYGGFIRWKNDPFKNYSYDPFADMLCSATGICSAVKDSSEGIVVGDVSSGFSYTNNDIYSKEISFKLVSGYCSSLTFSELAIYNENNTKIYFINNFSVSSSYSPNKIPFYAGYKVTLTPNTTSVANTNPVVNCGKYLVMRMLKYNDITATKSGFVSFRIVDHDSSQQSKNPNCTIYARIINPRGIHPLINDSSSLPDKYIFNKNTGSLNLPLPSSLGFEVKVDNSNFGTITLGSEGKNSMISNDKCSIKIDDLIRARYNECLTSNINPCILNTTTSSFSTFSECSSSGIGGHGQESSDPTGGGSGGGGGGNNNGVATLNSSTGSGIAGTSGTSFYNLFFHNSVPTTSSPTSSLNGYKGVSGMNGNNGQVKIYNCATGVSCTPTTFNYNSAVQYQTYNVPASGPIRYEIYGAGGGGGGSSCGLASNTLGGEGASGTIITGELKNIDATKTPTLRIYVGAGGPAGYSACSTKYSNTVSYSTPFSFTSVSPSKFSKIKFASYGFPVISTRDLTSSLATHNFAINPYCHSSASKVVAVDNCIGNSTCSIVLNNSTFNSLDLTSNCAATGNGENGASNTSSDNNGSGGGAGGGNGSLGTSASATGTIAGGVIGSNGDGTAGTSGDSYYDPGYHSSQPTVASASNANTNGSATITPSGGSATSFTSVGPSTYTVPAGTTSLSYVIKGAGGGNGGNASVSRNGGTGASGTQLTGSISVSAGDVINVNIGEKGYDGAGVCYYVSKVVFEGSSVNLSTHVSATLPLYGTPQRSTDTTYLANTYCNSSSASTNFNSNLSNTSYTVNDTNLGIPQNTGISPEETCQSGQGSSASSSTSLTNAGGAGGAGGGNGGTSTSGKINAGAVAANTVGGAGTSGESFFQPYYHQSAPASATTATNQANDSQSASDGVAILKQTSSSGTVLKNLTSATSDSYTVTANGTIYYELTGAGGGKGGKNSNTQTSTPGNGAGGAKITGTLNVKTGDVIKIYVGKAGTNGQNCGATKYFNTSEFTPLSISGLGCNISTIDFANYGTPNTSTTPYTVNAACSSGSLTANTNITTPCFGNASCSVYATNANFGDPCPVASSTNTFSSAGTNGSNGNDTGSLAGGGGGGGSYTTTSGGGMSQPGATGPSFYNTTYISTAPTLSNLSNNSTTSVNSNGSAGANGAIKLCDSNTTSNCQNFSAGISEYTIPSNGRFYFEISGAGGGAGGSGDAGTGGSGAGGTKIIGSVNQGVTANDKIYVYVGGGGAGGKSHSGTGNNDLGGSASSTSQYFLGANGGNTGGNNSSYTGSGGAGGGASFLNYKGNLVALASGGGGGGSGGASNYSPAYYTNGTNASSNSTLNSGSSSSSFFTYTLKKLAVQASCGSATNSKGIGGAISVSGSTINILKGGDGSETISGATCSGGGGGGGGGASALMINDETVAIAGGGGGGGGNNSSSGGTSATANTSLRNYLKVVPDKKYLVFRYVGSPTSSPSKSSLDTKVLGGSGGTISIPSGSYCSINSNGQGGDGGGGTMLSINSRVIAIAGGGGGGGGASINGSASSSRNAANSNNILDKLKAGPFGPYMAISAEYRDGTTGYVNSSQISNGSNLVINAPASSYFNDIAFASYGDNFTTPFLYANSCSKEDNLISLLQTNCLEKNTCTSAISNSLGGGQTCSNPANYKGLAKLTYQSSLQNFATAPVSTGILLGGNGGKNGLKECSGGGGAGGGATAISVTSHSDYTDAQEQFVAIAGGGGGGGGASCSGAVSTTANGSNLNEMVNILTNKALGIWISTQVSFPRPSVRNVPEDYYEYDDFAITDQGSADPLKALKVSSSAFIKFSGSNLNSEKIFVRKGQIIRFSPRSWDSNWNTKNNLTRQCGVGMAMQVEPRPALICAGSKQEKLLNPSCIPDFDPNSNTAQPLGCLAQSSICNGNKIDNVDHNVCTNICFKKITCSTSATEANNYKKSNCSFTNQYENNGSTCSLQSNSNTSVQNTIAACEACNNARLTAIQLPYYLEGNFDQCFDLENYTGKVINIAKNFNDPNIINSYIADKKLSFLKPFNGEYGNFENYRKISDNNYELKSPINSSLKGRLRFLVVDGSDLNVSSLPGAITPNSYSDNKGTATINPNVSLSARNGQWLQIKLCKEDSQTSKNCKSHMINPSHDLSTSNKSQAAVVDISKISSLSYNSINYNFDSNGNLYRETDPISGIDCNASSIDSSGISSTVSSILSPNASVATTKDAKFYCHTDTTDPKLLRLSFQIFDPENEDCNTETGSANQNYNGIKMSNKNFDSSNNSNKGAICNSTEIAAGDCKKEFICVDKYTNNSGKYEVKIKVKKNTGVTQLINSIIQPILYWLDGNPSAIKEKDRIGFAEQIYKSLITNQVYVLILKFSMVLAISFYGLGYLMGMSELSQTQIIVRVFKIGFIYLFVGEQGWNWFKIIFVNFYKDGVAQAVFLMTSSFNNSPELTQAINSGNFTNKVVLFSGTDQVITTLFSSAIHKKIWAFLFTGIFGWSYVLIFYFSIMNYIFALANSILLFITAQVMISLLFVMGPIFFIFLLFSQTKDMFDNWLKAMTGFGLQQIFLLTTLAFFNMLFLEVIKMSLGYAVCWDDAWVINLGVRFTITKFWVISSLPPRINMSDDLLETGNPESIPSLFSILYIWVVASLMKKMVTLMSDVASTISEGIKATEIGAGIAAIGSKIKSAGISATGSAISGATGRIDSMLFDSGNFAKKKKINKDNQAKNDMAARKSLLNAADNAEKKYKSDPNNVKKLANMNKEEQIQDIKRVRNEAIEKKANDMNIRGANKERIMNDAGLKYHGNNFFGALYQAGKQGFFTGGALLKNKIKEQDDNTVKIGREDAEKARENMSPSERDKFDSAVRNGRLKVEKNNLEMFGAKKKRIAGGILTAGLSELAIRTQRAIKNRFAESRYGTLRKEAIKQLEDQGLISPKGIKEKRNSHEEAIIRDKIRVLKAEKNQKNQSKVAANIAKKTNKNIQKRFKNNKKKLLNAISKAYKKNDDEKINKLNDIQDVVDNLEFDSDDNEEFIYDFNKTDFDNEESIDELMNKDSYNDIKNKMNN